MRGVAGLVCLIALCCLVNGDTPKVQINMYVMSKCPYAAQYVGGLQQNVLSFPGLSDIVNITMDYIATVDPTQPLGFSSKHGPTEVQGDLIEECVQNLSNDWFSVVVCADNDYDSIPNNLQTCIQKAGINYDAVNTCYQSTKSKTLLTASITRTDSLGWNPRPGSPTVYINGQCVYGYPPCTNLDPTTNQVLQYICQQYTGTKPAACSSFSNVISGQNKNVVSLN
eukprot:TRINITY_DN15398_c0_g1_i1.p1 TRINITY_DN15398_c0_g1~~TRINITY_DN15398_c0_g1_i1.p1  ORF type:complete len:225 (+),score=67.05 TRINITY_DN15398_c0_g1_i1:16-690(+)